MGIDLFATSPTAEGHYGLSWWYWRPIVDFLSAEAPELLPDDEADEWGVNEGHRVDADKARRIANVLDACLADGRAEACKQVYDNEPALSYRLDLDCLRKFSAFCRASGGFEIW